MANLKLLDFALPGTAAGVVPALYLQLADLFARGPVGITLRGMADEYRLFAEQLQQIHCNASFCSVILCAVYKA